MKMLPLLFLLWVTSQIYGNNLACPYGCGSSTDPNVGNVGRIILQSLEKIDFLEGPITIDGDDGDYSEFYEQALSGENGQLSYEASYNQYIEYVDDDEEDGVGPVVEEYHFSREKSWEDGGYTHNDAFGTYLSNYLETNTFMHGVCEDILFSNESHEYSKNMSVIEAAQARIDDIYRFIFDKCINNHSWSGSFYCRGLLNFHEGYFIDAFDDVSEYLKSPKQKGKDGPLPAEVYFYKGMLESEIGAYAAAVESLSKVIKENSENREAYFERAVAYYELGEFDLSLEDYLASGIRPSPIREGSLDMISFSLGMTTGILKGGAQAGIEFIPSLLSSLQGIGHGLWVFAQDPVQVSVELVQSAQACISFVKNNTAQETLEKIVPELRELFEQWDQLGDVEKGEIAGHIIGKYGVDIFASAGIVKGMKLYRDLRKANNLLTFEAMAISERNRALIKLESARRAQARREILRHGNLKIQWDKQGKHIPGHKNFESKNRSILEHPDPQKLANDFCGKGIKVGNQQPGTAGYQEIVNFGEFIGYSVDRDTGEKIATSWGKIHYAKDGVHIVPTKPRW